MGTNQSKTDPVPSQNLSQNSPGSFQSQSNTNLSPSHQTNQNSPEPFQRPKDDLFIFLKSEEKSSKFPSFFSKNGLSQDIIQVTGAEPDISLEAFYALYNILLPQIEKQGSVSLKDAWIIFIGGSIFKGSLCPPEKLIAKMSIRDIKRVLPEPEGEHKIFHNLDHVVKSIFDLKQKVIDCPDQFIHSEEIVASLDLLQEFYLKFKNQVKELVQAILVKEQINVSYVSEAYALEDLLEPKALIMSDVFVHHWAYRISRSKAQTLLSLDKLGRPLKSNLNDPSNHRVIALPEKTAEPLVYFKANGNPPIQPEKEFILYSLYRRLQIPVPETALVILTDVFEANPDYFYAVQASEAVLGDSSLNACKTQETVFDHEAYVSQAIGALLTTPSDGSFQNFKYTPMYQTLISIDNDSVFESELIDENTVNAKSILYLLPQIDLPIPESVQTFFTTLDPHLLIFSWLQDLSQKNREYQRLFAKLTFQKTRCFYQNLLPQNEVLPLSTCLQRKVHVDPELHRDPLHPQIQISKNLLASLTEKLQIIEKTLQINRSVSAQVLFEELSPILGKYYRKLRLQFRDPEEALEALWGDQKNGVDYDKISSFLDPEECRNLFNNKIELDENRTPETFLKEFKDHLISGSLPLDRFIRRHSQRRKKNILNLRQVLEELKLLIQEELTISESPRDIVDFCHCLSKTIDSDHSLVQEILSLLSNLPNSELKWLFTLEKCFRHSFVPKSLLPSSLIVIGAFMKQRTFILTEPERQYLFDSQGNIKRSPSLTGRSNVTFFPEKDPQFYLKQYPEWPGYELASTMFMRLLGTQHLPYHDLLIVNSKYPALLTQKINGQPVFRVWNNPQAFHNLDPFQTGLLIISAMLINPEDGKEDNFILSPDGKYLIPIDNDHCFLPSTFQKEGNFWNTFTVNAALQTKTLLFCLDEMFKPIPFEVKAHILSIDFDLLLTTWMTELDKLENKFNNLVDWNQRNKFLEQGTVMRIPFYKQFIQNIHWKVHLIQNMLRKTFELTPFDLLKAVEPFVAKCYQESFQHGSNLQSRFRAVTNQLYAKSKIDGSRMSVLNTRSMMEIINISEKELQKDLMLQRMGPLDCLELFTQLIQARSQKTQIEQEMLCELDDKKEEGIWSNLFGNPLVETALKAFLADPKEGLVLKGSKLITNSKLKKMFEQAPNQGLRIRFLSIPESPLLTLKEIKLFAEACPNLEYLNVSGSPKLKEIDTGKGEWPLLVRFEAKECSALERFVSHSPMRVLSIGTDKEIAIFIKNPSLDVFTISTKANKFELTFKTGKDFEMKLLGKTISNNDSSLGTISGKEEILKCFRDLKITIGTDLIDLPKDIGALVTRMNPEAARIRTQKIFQSTSQNLDLDERNEDETQERIIKKETQSVDDVEDIETSLALQRCHERYKLLKEKVSKVLMGRGIRSRLRSGDRKMDIDFISLLKYYFDEVATLDFPRNKLGHEEAGKLAKNTSWVYLFHFNVNCQRIREKEFAFSLTESKLLPSNTSWYDLSWLRDKKRRALPPFPPLADHPRVNTLAIDFEEAKSLSSIASWHNLSTDIFYFDNTNSTEASVLVFKATWAKVLKLIFLVNSTFSRIFSGEIIVLPKWTRSPLLHISQSEISSILSSPWTSLTQLDLSNNNIDDEGARVLAESQSLINLIELDLSFNKIGDESIHAFASSIFQNRNQLRSLNLSGNPISDSGIRAFEKSSEFRNASELNLNENDVEVKISQVNNLHVIFCENKIVEDTITRDQQQSSSFEYAELGQEASNELIKKTDSIVNEESFSGFKDVIGFHNNPEKYTH